MAHYAFLDDNNVVTEVIVGCDEGDTDWESHYSAVRGQRCRRTSYNTRHNQHANGGQPFRGNYAGVGYIYDEAKDVFLPPRPFPSFVLDESRATWIAPVPIPHDAPPAGHVWKWDEASLSWSTAPKPSRPRR